MNGWMDGWMDGMLGILFFIIMEEIRGEYGNECA